VSDKDKDMKVNKEMPIVEEYPNEESSSKTSQDRESPDNRIAKTGRSKARPTSAAAAKIKDSGSEDRSGSREEGQVDAGKTSTPAVSERKVEPKKETKEEAKAEVKEVAKPRCPRCTYSNGCEDLRGKSVVCANCRNSVVIV
jgi:hypothetical protein